MVFSSVYTRKKIICYVELLLLLLQFIFPDYLSNLAVSNSHQLRQLFYYQSERVKASSEAHKTCIYIIYMIIIYYNNIFSTSMIIQPFSFSLILISQIIAFFVYTIKKIIIIWII